VTGLGGDTVPPPTDPGAGVLEVPPPWFGKSNVASQSPGDRVVGCDVVPGVVAAVVAGVVVVGVLVVLGGAALVVGVGGFLLPTRSAVPNAAMAPPTTSGMRGLGPSGVDEGTYPRASHFALRQSRVPQWFR